MQVSRVTSRSFRQDLAPVSDMAKLYLTEKQVSSEIKAFLDDIGARWWSMEQGYRRNPGGTRMTPGILDLIWTWQGHGGFIEVKAERKSAKVRPEQQDFMDQWNSTGGNAVVARDVRDVYEHFVALGLIADETEPETRR